MADNQFKQAIFNKSRLDKFLLVLTMPQVLTEIKSKVERGNAKVQPDLLQFSVHGSPVPEVTVPEIETPFGGHTFKFTSFHRPSYSNVTVQFVIDNEFNNYWVIWKWLDMLSESREGDFDHFNVTGLPIPHSDNNPRNDPKYHKKYATNISIIGRDEYNNDRIKWDYYGAFPVSLQAIEYSDQNEEQIESSFSFAFSQMDCSLL